MHEIDHDISGSLFDEISATNRNSKDIDFPALYRSLINVIHKDELFFKIIAESRYCSTFASHVKKFLKKQLTVDFEKSNNVNPALLDCSIEYVATASTALIIKWLKMESVVDYKDVVKCIDEMMSKGFYSLIDLDLDYNIEN